MEVDLNDVLGAIVTLYDYQCTDRQKHDHASQWLGQLQRSVHAWKVADQLLYLKKDVNSCFFAAHTLRTKIQLHFSELPANAHDSLKRSMLDHLRHITDDTYQGIATQLCVAVADLVLHMAAWEDPICDLIIELGPESSSANLVPLLEVLIALPEELHSRQLRLGLNRRERLDKYFQQKVPIVIQLLDAIVKSEGHSSECTHIKVLRCLASWFSIPTQQWSLLNETCLVTDILAIVANPQATQRLHEITTDCVCSALFMLESVQIPSVAQSLFAGILQLEEAFHLAVALEDINAITNYARMFSEAGESLVEVMVSDPSGGSGSMHVLHLLLLCVGHHDWEVAEITFNFWYKLSEVLYQKNCDNVNKVFNPYVERLMEALYRHCQIEPDHEGILSQQDDFFEFRGRVQELVRDVIFICGSKPVFLQMMRTLNEQEVGAHWQLMEAALFIMQSVAKNLIPDENEVVPPVLQAILSQPVALHVQVTCTCIQLLSELNEWLASHPEMLPPVLTYLTGHLQSPQLATWAAKALDNICQSCRDHITDHFEGLMAIIGSLDNVSVSNEAVIGLLKGIASILSRLPREKINEDMSTLCAIQVGHLQQILQENNHTYQKNSLGDPVIWLDRLAAIFRSVNPILQNGEVHPCQSVILQVWPTLSAVFRQYGTDDRVVEHCCRCLRFAVRCVHQQSAPLLQPMVEQIVQLYTAHGHSSFLYLGSILVDEYGGEAGCVGGLLAMLQAFTVPTFAMLMQASGFTNHPDTVDDWFRLCTRFLQRAPLTFLECESLQTILECGLQACMLDHKDANGAVLKFFQDLMEVGRKHDERDDFPRRREVVTRIFTAHGETLVNNLITATVFILPPYMHHDVADTLFQMMLFDRAKFCVWLETKLKSLPRLTSGGVETVSETQLAEFHQVVTRAERTKEISRALSDFARLFT